MGSAERLIVNHLRLASRESEAWSTSKVAELLFNAERQDASKVRQTYRVLERARVIPAAFSADEIIARASSEALTREVCHTLEHARAHRQQVSIVQIKEVRLGQWALTWNNLRLARHWVWFEDDPLLERTMSRVATPFVDAHRLPCCMLFDGSASKLRDFLMNCRSDLTMEAFGDGGMGFLVFGRK